MPELSTKQNQHRQRLSMLPTLASSGVVVVIGLSVVVWTTIRATSDSSAVVDASGVASALTRVSIGFGIVLGGVLGLFWGLLKRRSVSSDASDAFGAADRLELLSSRLELASESAGLGTWDYDLEDGGLQWDARMHELYGTDPNQPVCYDDWVCALHEDDRDDAIAAFHDALDHQSGFDTTFRICVGDGVTRLIRATAQVVRDDAGRARRVVGVNWDITAEEASARELQETQELLEQSSRIGRIGGWALDLERMIPIWTDEVFRIHELEPGRQPTLEEAIEFYAPEGRVAITNAVNAAITTGEPFDIELPFITARMNRRWVRSIGTPEMRDGKCVRLWGAFQDLTDLRMAKQRLQLAVKAARISLWDWNIVTGDSYFDDSLSQMLGYEPDELSLTLDSWMDLCHPEDLTATMAAIERHMSGTDPTFEHEHRLRCKDGTWIWIRAIGEIVEWDEDGEGTRMTGVHIDITAARDVMTRLELALSAANAGLWDWNVGSGTFVSNETFHTMIGEKPVSGSIPLQYFVDRVHPDDLEQTMAAIAAAHDGEHGDYDAQFRFRCADDSYTWVRSTGKVIERAEDGSPMRMIGQHTDIDASMQAHEQMALLNDELQDQTAYANSLAAEAEEASLAKSEFLANMSHEIRTPMTAILGYADILDNEQDIASDPAQCKEAIRTIRSNANHLLRIINDILDMSKIEAGRMTVEQIDASPVEIVEDVERLMQSRAVGKGVALHVHYDTAIPSVIQSDPTRLRQVLLNLVGNALKFTEIGSVTIGVACDAESELIRFDVIDTGIGLTKSQQETIEQFDAFQQADGSTTRKFGGTGLGLRISNALASMLGGGISVSSKYGKGSTFSATISTGALDGVEMIDPRKSDDASSAGDARDGASADSSVGEQDVHLKDLRILLAEDGPDNQRLISFHLRKAGADVSIAENGKIALQMVKDAPADAGYDVVLMDMQMPEMDGYQATRKIRDAGFSIPILALTAHAMDGDRRRCLDAGCDDYLTKPIDKSHLLRSCRQWADGDAQRIAA